MDHDGKYRPRFTAVAVYEVMGEPFAAGADHDAVSCSNPLATLADVTGAGGSTGVNAAVGTDQAPYPTALRNREENVYAVP
ncbi:unannotated protein [freshwater metagenome]|uniref:Unannotated protein n=1 Tax=freshwater metagenome TaxID=449393 RepID=A0A6J5YB77_9ZZZZ